EIGRRLEAAEAAAASAGDRARAATAPLAAEIETLGSLVKQLAESVAAHETVLARTAVANLTAAASATAPAAAGSGPAEGAPPAAPAGLGEPEPARLAAGRFRGLDRAQVTALVTGGIEDNRVDLYLQPIVSLPQRKVRFYEAMARLRTNDGETLSP